MVSCSVGHSRHDHPFRDIMAIHHRTGAISRRSKRYRGENTELFLDYCFKVVQFLCGQALDVVVVLEGFTDFGDEFLVDFGVAAEVVGYPREGGCGSF